MNGNPPILYGPDNQPLPSSGPNPYGSYEVSRTAAGFRGTLSNWLVARNTKYSARRERQAIADRAEDLAANDTHAASSIDSITINTVVTGLIPQSRPNAKVLGWTDVTFHYLEMELGDSFKYLRRIKDLFHPEAILNPNTLFNTAPITTHMDLDG